MKNVKFKGRLITLSSKKVSLPNGYVTELDVITHPGAVLIIPFLEKDKIVLLRQLRPVLNIYMYELPAGTLKKDETHIECARREIMEETGYSAAKFTKLGVIYPVPGYSTEKIVIYKAEHLSKQDINMDKDEVITSFTVNKRRILEMFKQGRIVDAKTICALTMCGWL